MPNVNLAIIEDQNRLLTERLSAVLRPGTPYALVDFPNHSNVGDSAIWLGEIALLTKVAGAGPAYTSTADSFDAGELERSCPAGPLFIHGGGNFGDIWPHHQAFRERVLRTVRDRPVVQLPQSIKFRDPGKVGQCAEAIAGHPGFTLFVRDRNSRAFASDALGCPAWLVPDAAVGLGPLPAPRSPTHDVVLLLRDDSERNGYDLSPFAALRNARTLDWLEEPRVARRAFRLAAAVQGLLGAGGSAQDRRLALYNRLARHRVQRGLDILSDGRAVITDRLHAHILSFLLGLPHVALDNDYGKVSSYIAAWDQASPHVKTATSAREALEKLAQFGRETELAAAR